MGVGPGATAAMGGIWAMRFAGMLAFEMAMTGSYDLPPTVPARRGQRGGSGLRLAHAGRGSAREHAGTGTIMGLGVAAMQYTGVAAMRVPGNLAYDPHAVTTATAALWLTFRRNRPWHKLVAVCVTGLPMPP